MLQTDNISNLIEIFVEIDKDWLIAVNHGSAQLWLDTVMPVISERFLWITLAIFWLVLAWYRRNFRLLKQIIFVAAVLGFADYFAAQWLKPYFGRPRPCHAHSFVRIVSGCAGYYGFPSNHAVNGMVVATLMLSLQGMKVGLMIFGMVLAVGFSRIYLGVHYPFDVLMGYFVGASVAIGFLLIGRSFFSFLSRDSIP